MIIGIGTDIVKVSRIQEAVDQYGEQFLNRCFTSAERERSDKRHAPMRAYARLFAAKEALLKALGTGMREGLSWHDWEITPDSYGAPTVAILGGAADKLVGGSYNIRLSMSDDHEYAVAFAIIERKNA
jgi:holo-[acyl-carrier protein] synthase